MPGYSTGVGLSVDARQQKMRFAELTLINMRDRRFGRRRTIMSASDVLLGGGNRNGLRALHSSGRNLGSYRRDEEHARRSEKHLEENCCNYRRMIL